MPPGKGCTVINLLSCLAWWCQTRDRVRRKSSSTPSTLPCPCFPLLREQYAPNPSHRVPSSSCSQPVHGQGEEEPFWGCPCPQSSAWG